VNKAWNWLKERHGYVYAGMFLALALWEGLEAGWTWWIVFDVVAAAVFLFIYQCPLSPFVKPKTFAVGRAAITVGSKEDVPAPPPPAWLEAHRQEVPDCSLCKAWGWDKL
jgi:hypothetical protein